MHDEYIVTDCVCVCVCVNSGAHAPDRYTIYSESVNKRYYIYIVSADMLYWNLFNANIKLKSFHPLCRYPTTVRKTQIKSGSQ